MKAITVPVSSPLRRTLKDPFVYLVLLLVLGWNYAFSLEQVGRQFPLLIDAQYRFHQLLYWLVWQSKPRFITVIEIGDNEYWNSPLSGRIPTNRHYLADLIRHVADSGAPTIVLDFNLSSSTGVAGQDLPEYAAENADLLKAIRYATDQKGVRVVLGFGLVDNRAGKWKRESSIFSDSELPLCSHTVPQPLGCVLIGHINLPNDRRQIALQMTALDWDNSSERDYDSLALGAVTAFESRLAFPEKTREKRMIASTLKSHGFVFGRFVRDWSSLVLPIRELWANSDRARQLCENHIVLIGSTWSKNRTSLGTLFDGHVSPVGELAGVFFHANYISSLLEEKYRGPVPLWAGMLIDALVGIALYFTYHLVVPARKLRVLGIFFGLLLLTYVVFANLNYYLDFVLPLMLCFVHLLLDYFWTKWKGTEQQPAG